MKSTTPVTYYDLGDRITEAELAARTGMTVRGLRMRRQRGVAPPYVKDGREIIYSWRKYLEFLERNERRPVRSRPRREAETPAA